MPTHTNTRRLVIMTAVGLTLSACSGTNNAGGAGETDAFLRDAFDAYGVIDVIPAQPQNTSVGQPLDATTATARTMTLEQACEGRTGIQRGLRDQATGQPIDCGSGVPTS